VAARIGSASPARRLGVVGDPDVGLVVEADIPLTVHMQQGQPLGKHIPPGLWERRAVAPGGSPSKRQGMVLASPRISPVASSHSTNWKSG
jgi:hypothetical protein